MGSKPTREGQTETCPECKEQGREITVTSVNKPYQGKPRLSWRNSDGSAHSAKTPDGKWKHVASKQEGIDVSNGRSTTVESPKTTSEPKTIWPVLSDLSDVQEALYGADDLIEAMAVEKTRKANPGLEESNPHLFGQIVSSRSHRIALVNLAKAIKDGPQ